MRSFIRAHRRNESNNSETFDVEHLPPGSLSSSKTTPAPSPVLLQTPQFTPVQNFNLPSVSSPKKLLTPIKNLFTSSGHHSKSVATTPSSNESLNGSARRRGHRYKHSRSHSSVSNFSLLSHSESIHKKLYEWSSPSEVPISKQSPPTTNQKLIASPHFRTSNSSPSLVNPYKPFATSKSKSHTSLASYQYPQPAPSQLSNSSRRSKTSPQLNNPQLAPSQLAPSQLAPSHLLNTSQSQPKLMLPISLIESVDENSINESNTSLVESENNFETKQVSFQQEPQKAFTFEDSDTESNSDDEDDESDSSSQFSFVKDRRGGRNTSIKYYKMAKSPQEEQNELLQLNTFNENDLGYEVDEFSDYDFENNGMDDDYDEEGEGEVQYNNLFDGDGGSEERDIYISREDEDESSTPDGNSLEAENSLEASLEVSDQQGDLGIIKDQALDGVHEDSIYDEDDTFEAEVPVSSPGDTKSNLGNDIPDTDSYNLPLISNENIPESPINFNSSHIKALESSPFPTGLERDNSGKYLEFFNDSLSKDYRVFNNSYHLSIQGSVSQGENESLETDTYGDDILENYLDISQLPSLNNGSGSSASITRKTPEPQSAEVFELYDVSSPVISGLTIGHNLQHRLRRENSDSPNSNKMFIHRLVSIDQDDVVDERMLKITPSNEEVLKLRTLRSFHGSLGDDTNRKILKKIDDFEKFIESRKPESNLGLGIENGADDEDRATLNETQLVKDMDLARLSVGELMGIVETLEKDEVNDATKELELKELELKELELKATLLNLEGTNDKARTEDKSNIDDKSEIDDKSNIEDKSKNTSKNTSKIKSLDKSDSTLPELPIKRLSILGMMNLLANLEQSQAQISQENGSEKAKENRRSIIDMMTTLASLETKETIDEEETKNKRDSINNMMNTLAKLDLSNLENASLAPQVKPRKLVKNPMKRLNEENTKKRYSWFNNDESLSIKNVKAPPKSKLDETSLNDPPKSNLNKSPLKNDPSSDEDELSDNEQYHQPLDQELLDEINQFSEDFDMEDNSIKYKSPTTPNFLRSNSYNKKPIKALMDNKYQSNKIETLNKTVTFYRTNSTGTPSDSRSRSISRAPSTRSVTSFTSFNECDEEEEEVKEITIDPRSRLSPRDIEEPPFVFKITSDFKSTDSFKNVNLTTITEADSPLR
jgi:hypothetical protein